jgi:hypothetical protein
MGAIADAWAMVKKEISDLKAQNAALESQATSSSPPLDAGDQTAITELENEAAALATAQLTGDAPPAPASPSTAIVPAAAPAAD